MTREPVLVVCGCGWRGDVAGLLEHARESHGREAVTRVLTSKEEAVSML
jgi:hypothetical protein